MKITIHLNDENLKDLEPLLKRSNRTIHNYVQSLVLATIAAYKRNSTNLDIDNLGRVNPVPKVKE